MDRFKITLSDFRELLRMLIEKGIVSSILSGKEKGNRYTIEPEFISEKEKIDNFPLSQLLVYGFGRTDSAANSILHTHKALIEKIAVIGHACDVRALIEIAKKNQALWENLFLITFEDMGYIEVNAMMKYLKKEKIEAGNLIGERLTSKGFFLKIKDNSQKKVEMGKEFNVAENCSRCIEKQHPNSDLLISVYGLPEQSEDYIITPLSKRAKSLVDELKWDSRKVSDRINTDYDKDAISIIEQCQEKRESELDIFEKDPNRLKLLAKCTGCGLCVKSCPVCFCVQCSLVNAVKAKQIDKLTFVMTRFSHVGDTCVECGKCNSNCPVNVPLALVFQSLRRKFKKNHAYEAGADLKTKVLHLDI